MALRIAVTGGEASGKSTVLEILRSKCLSVFSADAAAHEVLKDRSVREKAMLLLELNRLDSQSIRLAIKSDARKRRRFDDLLHPMVWAKIDASGATFIEIPLLVETCLCGCFDFVWTVSCGRREQESRLFERHGQNWRALDLTPCQLGEKERRAFSDVEIRTNQGVKSVELQLESALRHIKFREVA